MDNGGRLTGFKKIMCDGDGFVYLSKHSYIERYIFENPSKILIMDFRAV